MNKARRKWLRDVINSIEDAQSELESISEEEEEAYNNLPENLQDSEMGNTMYDNIDTLQTATSDIGDIIDNLNEII